MIGRQRAMNEFLIFKFCFPEFTVKQEVNISQWLEYRQYLRIFLVNGEKRGGSGNSAQASGFKPPGGVE
jgi:hypothetical protein